MKSFKINLHKKHIPLNSNLILNSQEEYDFHIETLLFLNNQIDIGFKPDYFITFHYRHPSERYSAKKQTNNPLGWKDRYGCLLYTSPSPRDYAASRMPSSA